MTPYADLPEYCFWKAGVSRSDPLTVKDLYQPKVELGPRDWIATAGSCFAEHVAGALKQSGYRYRDVELGPPWLDQETLQAHGYGLHSARYGNIYTARQLLQLAREAFEEFQPAEVAWQRKDRFYDAMRPSVDPQGLDSVEEVSQLRGHHLMRVRQLFSHMNVFIFTVALTEAWADASGSTVFPTAPGVLAGTWDAGRYQFVDFSAEEILADLNAFRELVTSHNRHFRMIVSVSPIPLMATAADRHVLVSDTGSKAALRAAAGAFAKAHDNVDYFPAFELIATPFSRTAFYEQGLRAVSQDGIDAALRVFFQAHPPIEGTTYSPSSAQSSMGDGQLAEVFAE
ncbi:MAG: GSCFA domain-containing protein [Pseudomonadota bacterium]